MRFIHEPLTWAFFLALLPLLIHLINMMRHKRMQWAAMDFLLAAYKKHRKWIWLKQFLLMAMRMAIVAIAVAMLAQLVTLDRFAALFGDSTTHHYILLDDSYSMADSGDGQMAFERAKQVAGRIASRAVGQNNYSRAAAARGDATATQSASGEQSASEIADLFALQVDSDIDLLLEEKRRTFEVSELSVGPEAALALVQEMQAASPEENNVVYLVSDFRQADWNESAQIERQLTELKQSDKNEIHLVSCVRNRQRNLAITALEPTEGTRAAGVPLFVNVTVKNYSTVPEQNVQVRLKSHFYSREQLKQRGPEAVKAETEDLPVVMIEEIKPGQAATRRVQVYFAAAGEHVVEASLAADAVETDNHRWCVIDFPEGEPVLVIDGEENGRGAYYLTSAFEPGNRANTGVRVTTENAAFLRDVTEDALRQYRAIYLLDVPKLDGRAVANLEAYVRAGGGLGIFLGPHVDRNAYNEAMYREGEGLFPLPLEREEILEVVSLEPMPDIEPHDHPVFRPFLGERNPLIRHVTVERYYEPMPGWAPPIDSGITIAATLRNGIPLCVEKKFGEGVVLTFLSTAAPAWNNWALDPSFVVVALKMQAYLAAALQTEPPRQVGEPLAVQLAADQFRDDVEFYTPKMVGEGRTKIERTARKPSQDSPVKNAILGVGLAQENETGTSGVYEAWAHASSGEPVVQRFALNINPAEGDLQVVTPNTLTSNLAAVKPVFSYWGEYEADVIDQAGFNWSYLLLALLVLFLLLEQLLAYSASYHPPRGATA